MAYHKYIIEGEVFIMGKVTYHHQLTENPDSVKGGGMVDINAAHEKIYTLYGRSLDFGSVSFDFLKKVILSGEIYMDKNKTRKIVGGRFFYQDEMFVKTEIK